jgi:thymidylate kinase
MRPLHCKNHSGPLLVEFIGVTGVGKSTLIRALAEALARRQLRVRDADEVVLAHYGLAFIRHAKARSAVLHLLALLPLLGYFSTRAGRRLLRLALGSIARGAREIWTGFGLVRNVVKRIGCHLLLEEMRCGRTDCDIVLCDEGIVHAAHNLFVHTGTEPSAEAIMLFGHIVPKPDLVVWVAAPPTQSAAVIRQRGHARVCDAPGAALAFAEHAHATFELLAHVDGLAERTVVMDNSPVPAHRCAGIIHTRAAALATLLTQYLPGSSKPEHRDAGAAPRNGRPRRAWAARTITPAHHATEVWEHQVSARDILLLAAVQTP